jgi:hypothetical protein
MEDFCGKSKDRSLLSRIFCMESVICCAGIGCVVYGLIEGLKIMQLFFGVCIIGGSFALRLVRKKDWDAHWAEMEMVRKAHELRAAQERDEKR